MQPIQHDSAISIREKQGVITKEFSPDDDSWAWSTLQHLAPDCLSKQDNPGREEHMEPFFKLVMDDASQFNLKNVFCNPPFLVTSDKPTPPFLRAARKAQGAWFQRVRAIFGSSGRAKRELRKMTPIIRQLSHTGILIVDGKHVLPNQWPDRPEGQKVRDLYRHRFGKLVVIEMLPKRRCRCICDCGQETIVLKQQLLKGKTKSCGCL